MITSSNSFNVKAMDGIVDVLSESTEVDHKCTGNARSIAFSANNLRSFLPPTQPALFQQSNFGLDSKMLNF